MRELLTAEHAVKRRRQLSVTGGHVSVGRLLSGHPVHMVNRPKQPGKRVVTFFNETFISAAIDPDIAIIRAAVIAALVDILEAEGYSCEIVAALTTTREYQVAVGHHGTVTLKTAGERLNLSDIVFGLGHPSFFRRLCFAMTAGMPEARSCWGTQGYPAIAFNRDNPTTANEFYLRCFTIEMQHLLPDTDDKLAIARKMLKMIQPKNFPVRISDDG